MREKLCQELVSLLALVSLGLSMPLPSARDLRLPQTITDYFKQRDTLLEDEKIFENRVWTLTEDEVIVDRFLHFLKWKDVEKTREIGFYPSRQIQNILPEIRSSELYQLLIGLPKGGNLHSHENQQLSKKKLLDIVWSSKDFGNLYVVLPLNDTHPTNSWSLDFFVNPPPGLGWINVKERGIKKEDILKNSNFVDASTYNISGRATDSTTRWQFFNKLVDRAGSNIINNIEVKKKYFSALYNESLSEGITYLETRRSYSPKSLYELDFSGNSSKTYGKKYLNTDTDFSREIGMVLSTIKEFKEENPRFIGHKTIVAAVRGKSQKDFQKSLDGAIELHRNYSNHIIGFDNVGEEDSGFSTLHFLKNYLSGFSEGRPSIPLYLHSVETNWPDDLMASEESEDLVPTLQNAYEAILLQPKRIGHGKGFSKTPYLRQLLKERKIAVEACLVSNQILGYDPDLRNHFGQYFYREGIPVVLASDDPGSIGYDGVAVDWYFAFISWGLKIGDLKRLALNSLEYSGMNETEKKSAIEDSWRPSWNEYIKKLKNLACGRKFAAEALNESRFVTFTKNNVFPKSGPAGTKIHVFGRNFEVAICKKPMCKIGNLSTEAVYLSNRHLMCTVPECEECLSTRVVVSVALDGENYESLKDAFLYDHAQLSGSPSRVPNAVHVFMAAISLFIELTVFQDKVIF